ncbi:histidine utilization repressor [Aquabacterium sp. A7-Y]|uniref:histidine utilization repressor n=1 Tax=Aquabacterium sp. A7-Y TaxID=1349605 RepID=UPI00223E168E|nr:histidine utilization repressor [Aquabacterium sp. A7-Y]MCW7541639.1 histidine utilization repressor [Aquabacterium sp. A7-Y]
MSSQAAAPEYLKLKRHILGRIAAGDWRAGERIPSEGELTREFGLSRMTVNRALRELAATGAITRVQGVGSFVAGPKAESTLVEVHGIRDEIRQRGQRHRAEVLALRRVEADALLAQSFGIAVGAPLFHSLLLHHADEQPLQLEDRHVNPGAVPHYLAQDFTLDTPHHYLSRVAPLEQAEHVIEADAATPETARHLQLQPDEAVLILNRRTWSHGRVVSVARLIHPARRYRLSGRFSFTQPQPPHG